MASGKLNSLKSSYLLRRFTLLFIGFSLVPLGILFYLYTQYDDSNTLIQISRDQLHIIVILVSLVCLIGFLGMRSSLVKVVLLAENLRKSVFGKMDKDIVLELMKEEGEVAELAKSFGQVFERLQSNIQELEETKRTLYDVLSKVSKALSSMENFDVLVQLILETTIESLCAQSGVIFVLDEERQFVLKAWAGPTQVTRERVTREAKAYLEWVRKEHQMFVSPRIDEEEKQKVFNSPLICVPLFCRDKLWGALCLCGHKFNRNFSQDELQILSTLSYQIAISFENVQLNKNMERAYFETMSALALAVEARDPYSRGHSEQVGVVAVKIGKELELDKGDVQTLRDAARLHDIGKIGITDSLLLKPASLSEEEREIMKRHPVIGESIVRPLKTFSHLLEPIRHHHEYLDGSGYPDGLKGAEISRITRIMTVADIYDALIGDRPYRKAFTLEQTKDVLDSLVNNDKVDADIVRALYRVLDREAQTGSPQEPPANSVTASSRISAQ